MSSQHIAAKPRSIRHSTGPRTDKGKARSRLNALRHGLAAKLPSAGTVDRDVARLASAIAGPNPDPCRLYFAQIAAEAELELRRVRAVRLALLAPSLPADLAASGPTPQAQVSASTLLKLPHLDRYEQRALSRRNRALRLL